MTKPHSNMTSSQESWYRGECATALVDECGCDACEDGPGCTFWDSPVVDAMVRAENSKRKKQ
jgi:hypothetical protein